MTACQAKLKHHVLKCTHALLALPESNEQGVKPYNEVLALNVRHPAFIAFLLTANGTPGISFLMC